MKAAIKATYSRGHRPLQMTYGTNGLVAEFTLMTKGTSSTVTDAQRADTTVRGLSVRPPSHPASGSRAGSEAPSVQSGMPPPDAPSIRKTLSDSRTRLEPDRLNVPAAGDTASTNVSIEPSAPSASMNQDSMFFPAADDDQQWEPPSFEDDDGMVTWDNEVASAFDASTASRRKDRDVGADAAATHGGEADSGTMEIAPTQRLSQIKGMFD